MDQDAASPPQPPFTASLSAAGAKLTSAEHGAYRAEADLMAHRFLLWPGGWREWLLAWGLWVAGCALALAGAVVAVVIGVVREHNGGAVVVLLFVAYALGVYLTDRRQRRYGRLWGKAQRDAVANGHGARRYTLDDEGMSFSSEALQGRMPWSAFSGAQVAGGLLLLRADRICQVSAIPLRAFASPEEAEAAAEYARGKVALPGEGEAG